MHWSMTLAICMEIKQLRRSSTHHREKTWTSTHWLRYTGASQEIEPGWELKDSSEDLGHSSMAATDTIHVQTENKKRAESGKQRKVHSARCSNSYIYFPNSGTDSHIYFIISTFTSRTYTHLLQSKVVSL